MSLRSPRFGFFMSFFQSIALHFFKIGIREEVKDWTLVLEPKKVIRIILLLSSLFFGFDFFSSSPENKLGDTMIQGKRIGNGDLNPILIGFLTAEKDVLRYNKPSSNQWIKSYTNSYFSFNELLRGKRSTMPINTYLTVDYRELDLYTLELLVDSADYFLNRSLGNSLKYAHQAKFLAEKSGVLSNELRVLTLLGKINLELGLVSQAADFYLTGLDKIRKVGLNISDFPLILLGIGEILILIHEPDKARTYLDLAMNRASFAPSLGSNLFAQAQEKFGKLYLEKKEWKRAFTQLNEGIMYLDNQPPSCLKTTLHNLMGEVYLAINNNELSKHYFNQAEISARHQGDKNGLSHALMGLGTNSYLEGSVKSAIDACLEAFHLSDSLGNELRKRIIAGKLSLWYKEINQLDSSSYFLLVENDPFFDVQHKNAKTKIFKTELIFELKDELSELERKKNQELTHKSILLLVLSLSLIGCWIVVIHSRIKNKIISKKLTIVTLEIKNLESENNKLNLELLQKERKLISNLIRIFKREKQIEEMTKKLVNLKSQAKKPYQKIITGILDEFDAVRNDGSSQQVKEMFFDLNKGFFERLEKDFPNMTVNEKFLCVFLCMGLDLSEISAITGAQVESIRVSKSRLKKKLGLVEDEMGFQNFLMTYQISTK